MNYNAQVGHVKIEDITLDEDNQIILHRLINNDPSLTDMSLSNDPSPDSQPTYVTDSNTELGWLGYFLGKHSHLRELDWTINDHFQPLCSGLCHNRSIKTLWLHGNDLYGGEIFQMLAPFFKDNHNLTKLAIFECGFQTGFTHQLALTLGGCTKSLKVFDFSANLDEDDESIAGFNALLAALSMHPQLEKLQLSNCSTHIGSDGIEKLTPVLSKLQFLISLELKMNDIDDDSLDHLLPALANNEKLQELSLFGNTDISKKGWKKLLVMLGKSNVIKLDVSWCDIDDDKALTFATALANNCTLKVLNLAENVLMTSKGWDSFLPLLCNNSSIENTFLSNHTLQSLDGFEPTYHSMSENTHDLLDNLLYLNTSTNKKEVAIKKILNNHNQFDMQPFFEWEFKVLPHVVNWLRRAEECDGVDQGDIRTRNLAALYQFIRGMPVLYIESRLLQQLKEIRARKMKLQLELEEAGQLEKYLLEKLYPA